MPTDPHIKLVPPIPVDAPRVLLVDDDPALLQLLSRWLTGYGIEILTAGSGLEALTCLQEWDRVTVVVSDYYMPGMNGVQLLESVRIHWPDVKRILYTAHADSDIVIEAINHKVLTKQMDAFLVRDAILRAAKGRPTILPP